MERPSRHHVFHERAWYKTHLEKSFRNIGGLVVPMFTKYHNRGDDALHNNVPPPPKPNRQMMLYVLGEAHELSVDHVLAVDAVAQMFGKLATRATTEHEEMLALNVQSNLEHQLLYIEAGYWHQ
jgi:hypothetical protein